MLRPRYHPDWNPSWAGAKKYSEDLEDAQVTWVRPPLRLRFLDYTNEWHGQRLVVMDATRISDGRVVLKKVNKTVHPYQAEIGQLLSTEPLPADPHNHSVPV